MFVHFPYKNFGFFILCGILFCVLSVGYTYIELVELSNRIQEDITYHDGNWDTTAYNSDPLITGRASMYILARDGFVIERWKPISGFLDVSDFKHLLAFTSIQTIQTSSMQDWRILSLPVKKDEEVHGVVTVSSYYPIPEVLSSFDQQLQTVAKYIHSHISVEDNSLTVRNLDQRKIPHFVSFQIVNKYNKIIFKGNNTNSIDRLPNFIDPSYVASQLQASPVQLISDAQSGEIFLLYSQPLRNEQGDAQGVIVVGQSLEFVSIPLLAYITVISLLSAGLVIVRFQNDKRQLQLLQKPKARILFDEKNSQILIDATKIPIAYASNQYYLCSAVIRHPHKRWEIDALMEKMGEEHGENSWRKIYDAVNQINKKAFPILGKKLIVLEDKTYRMNPHLL